MPAGGTDLDGAILDYLNARGFPHTAAAFRDERLAVANRAAAVVPQQKLPDGDTAPATLQADAGLRSSVLASPTATILEKKWHGVLRLQRKNLELEAQIAALTVSSAGIRAPLRQDNRASALGPLQGDSHLKESSSLMAASAAPSDVVLRSSTPKFLPKLSGSGGATSLLLGHRGEVTSVSFHPRATLVASAGEDAGIKIWDYESLALLCTLRGHRAAVCSIRFDPVAQISLAGSAAKAESISLVSGSEDLTVRLWELRNDNSFTLERTFIGHKDIVYAALFLPPLPETPKAARRLISCGRDATIRIWGAESGHCLQVVSTTHSNWIRDIACTLDGRYFAVCSDDETSSVWSVKQLSDPKMTLRGHSHVVECILFMPASSHLYIAKLLNMTSSSQMISLSRSVFALSGSRDKDIILWDAMSGKALYKFQSHGDWIRSLACHPCGAYFYSVSADKSLCTWKVETGECIMNSTAAAHANSVSAVSVSLLTSHLATAGVDGAVIIWDLSPDTSQAVNKSSKKDDLKPSSENKQEDSLLSI